MGKKVPWWGNSSKHRFAFSNYGEISRPGDFLPFLLGNLSGFWDSVSAYSTGSGFTLGFTLGFGFSWPD
jgi:hypothetical protein